MRVGLTSLPLELVESFSLSAMFSFPLPALFLVVLADFAAGAAALASDSPNVRFARGIIAGGTTVDAEAMRPGPMNTEIRAPGQRWLVYLHFLQGS